MFLLNRFGKTQLKLLKSVITDFYNADVIAEAKCQLLDDVGRLMLMDKLPYIPKRRDGENRIMQKWMTS